MSEASSYPPIEPDIFELIVVGTGLPSSVIAAAAASASGKTVLHRDPNPFYGSHFTSQSISELTAFLNHHSTSSEPRSPTTTSANSGDVGYTIVNLARRSLYSGIDISSHDPEVLAGNSRSFDIDLGGPRVLFCADKAVDILVKSGAGNYVEFKSIDASFVSDENGRFWNVPDSRAAIFKDKTLPLIDKNQMMRFFKLVQRHLEACEVDNVDEGGGSLRISAEDLESPFVEFLKKMRLPPIIKSIILYAIAMADYDQNDLEVGKDILTTKDGIERLALYNKSVGRFPNAPGAFIYPIYGHGELSQALCRRAAVKGGIYVLRMPVMSVLMDKESVKYKGVRLASGQDVFSKQLVLDPAFTDPSPPKPLVESLENLSQENVNRKVARGICVLARSWCYAPFEPEGILRFDALI